MLLNVYPVKTFTRKPKKIAQNFQNAGLPAITAHPKGIYQCGPYYFQLFNWINRKKLATYEISPEQAEIIRTLLVASFHANTLQPS